MLITVLTAAAATGAAAAPVAGAAPAGPFGWIVMLVPYLAIFAVFWWFVLRPQANRAKQHRAKIAAVKPRDQVVTAGGIMGRVTKVEDNSVDVEIAQGVRVKVVKATLADVLLPDAKSAND